MKTQKLYTEMEKKHGEVVKKFQNVRNKELIKLTGLSAGTISDIKAGKRKFINYKKLLKYAERLGL